MSSQLSAVSSQPRRLRLGLIAEHWSLLLHNLYQVRDFRHHAANCGVVRTLDYLVQPGESQTLDNELLFYRGTNGGAHPLQVNLSAARIRFLCCHSVTSVA